MSFGIHHSGFFIESTCHLLIKSRFHNIPGSLRFFRVNNETMKSSNSFSISQRIKSFKYAFEGLKTLFIEEHNARIHLVSALIAIVLGFVFKISMNEWISLILVMGLVFICELINTSLEAMADFASLEKHPQIKKVKDLAAASVLISAIVALLVGLIIFCPKIIETCTHS